jgi:hypothetical protein
MSISDISQYNFSSGIVVKIGTRKKLDGTEQRELLEIPEWSKSLKFCILTAIKADIDHNGKPVAFYFRKGKHGRHEFLPPKGEVVE